MPDHIMTFDIGTSSLKAALIDRLGKVVAEGGTSYPVDQPEPGWAEQDPELIWKHICETSQSVISRSAVTHDEIQAVVFVAPWKNIICLNEAGELLRDSIIWMDSRAAKQAEKLNAAAGRFIGTGQEYWPRLMWVKEHEPELWQQSAHIVGLNTWFKFKATGNLLTEPSDDFIRSQNPELNDYYQSVLNAAGLTGDIDKFPPARDSYEAVGTLQETAASQLGIRAGVPVMGGFGDLVAITWGVGRSQLRDNHLYFGTSSWLVSIINKRSELDAPLYFSIDKATEGAVFALQTGCLALDWVVNQVYRVERTVLESDIYSLIGKEVNQIPPGSDGVIATHWMTGELAPFSKNAKGLFLNLTISHDRRHMARAMMESICFTHRHNIERLNALSGTTLDHIRVVGGGAVSDVWMQMLADILQIRIQIPEAPRYTGTLGAYYCAAIGLGWLESLAEVADNISIQKEFLPNPANRDAYDRHYRIYMKIHPALKDIHRELNGEY
ncbi:carbohydrate kinase [Candidatus Pantoea deserta]|uniref:Carbohydrate kinase n=1 Tax=Candidatus Pantoea deserta TaxID=1869313 RepID=A0A3N4P7M2_9GAMM|nr:FGGY family carbohydrate kinase [Pantoea deserta]RPD99709.1 carbohydrate kinase [Pantoea deserta]